MQTLSQLQMGTGNGRLILGSGGNVVDQLNQTTTASANASMALLNLNYVIRDSPYFFQNFALGVLAVGNNLNPFSDRFFFKIEARGRHKIINYFCLIKTSVGGWCWYLDSFLIRSQLQSKHLFFGKQRRVEKQKQ